MSQSSAVTLESSNGPSDITAPPPVGIDGCRRALVSLATADSVPGCGEGNTGDENDGGVVHVVESDGESGGHAEEGDGEADPGWSDDVSCVNCDENCTANTYHTR